MSMTAAIVTIQRANQFHGSYSSGGGGPEYEGPPSHNLPEMKPPVDRVAVRRKLFGVKETNYGLPVVLEAKTYRGIVKEKGTRRKKVVIEVKRQENENDILLINAEPVIDLDHRKVLLGRNALSRFIVRRRLTWTSTGWREVGKD